MTVAHPARSTGGASRDDEGATAALGAADWLSLSAAPTFAIMALLTSILGGSQPDVPRPQDSFQRPKENVT